MRPLILTLAALVALPVAAQQRPTPASPPSDDAPRTLREMHEGRAARASTPDAALRELMLGNMRFFDGHGHAHEFSATNRRSYMYGQRPHAAILSCSDSRAPAEMLFDQRIGDVFSVRNAGNVASPDAMGSLEFAVAELGTSIVVVMGHEGCGAVEAALLPAADRRGLPENLGGVIGRIVPAVQSVPALPDDKARMRVAVIENIRHQMRALAANPVMAQAVREGRIRIVGAYYELRSGAVEFIDDATAQAR